MGGESRGRLEEERERTGKGEEEKEWKREEEENSQGAVAIITAKRDFDWGQNGSKRGRSGGYFLKIVNRNCQELAKRYGVGGRRGWPQGFSLNNCKEVAICWDEASERKKKGGGIAEFKFRAVESEILICPSRDLE